MAIETYNTSKQREKRQKTVEENIQELLDKSVVCVILVMVRREGDNI
jgi:hypothetical protein